MISGRIWGGIQKFFPQKGWDGVGPQCESLKFHEKIIVWQEKAKKSAICAISRVVIWKTFRFFESFWKKRVLGHELGPGGSLASNRFWGIWRFGKILIWKTLRVFESFWSKKKLLENGGQAEFRQNFRNHTEGEIASRRKLISV